MWGVTLPFPGISRCDVENVRRVAQNILGEDVQHIENINIEGNKNVRRVAGLNKNGSSWAQGRCTEPNKQARLLTCQQF